MVRRSIKNVLSTQKYIVIKKIRPDKFPLGFFNLSKVEFAVDGIEVWMEGQMDFEISTHKT